MLQWALVIWAVAPQINYHDRRSCSASGGPQISCQLQDEIANKSLIILEKQRSRTPDDDWMFRTITIYRLCARCARISGDRAMTDAFGSFRTHSPMTTVDVAAILAIAILPFLAVVIFQWVRDGDGDGDRGEKKGREKRMGWG
ncbi:hypothetical protein TIFTF001_027913 [Ficus carica]|uniref:Uncharacterized protein n=1 Tax=Ficus carica TaxID=3494 RepID=A0AA88DNY7_FICCA|nr:hypothetical protein TIFTF001_027913 [Ficus carica]